MTRLPGSAAVPVLAAAVVAGCGLLAPAGVEIPIEELDTTPRELVGDIAAEPMGPQVEVLRGTLRGTTLTVAAQAGLDGVCLGVFGEYGSSSCGPVPEDLAGMMMTMDGDEIIPLSAVVPPAVDRFVGEMPGGALAHGTVVSLEPAGIEAKAVVMFVAEVPDALVFLDRDGNELTRLAVRPPNR